MVPLLVGLMSRDVKVCPTSRAITSELLSIFFDGSIAVLLIELESLLFRRFHSLANIFIFPGVKFPLGTNFQRLWCKSCNIFFASSLRWEIVACIQAAALWTMQAFPALSSCLKVGCAWKVRWHHTIRPLLYFQWRCNAIELDWISLIKRCYGRRTELGRVNSIGVVNLL